MWTLTLNPIQSNLCDKRVVVTIAIVSCEQAFRAHSLCVIFYECECDSSYRFKWVVWHSMEVFTLCDCDNIRNSYLAHYKQKQIAFAIRKKVQCEWALRHKRKMTNASHIQRPVVSLSRWHRPTLDVCEIVDVSSVRSARLNQPVRWKGTIRLPLCEKDRMARSTVKCLLNGHNCQSIESDLK